VTPPTDTMLDALVGGRHPTPFAVLGIHPITTSDAPGRIVRSFLPGAEAVAVLPEGGGPVAMERVHSEGLFEARFPAETSSLRYRLRIRWPDGGEKLEHDPYRFGPVLDEERIGRFNRGEETRLWEVLGARTVRHEGVDGTVFGVWAPNARAVGLAGEMNGWDGRRHPMRPRGSTGVWELFVPGVQEGALYKYEIHGPDPRFRVQKADPVGRRMELRPGTASVVCGPDRRRWTDDAWIDRRSTWSPDDRPVSIYEVHLGSWKRVEGRAPGGLPGWPTYRELADDLLPYVDELGFTHVELLPITEHPLDESWGYQTIGLFAPTSRYGSLDDLRAFVDRAHELGIGVVLDWVPGHFPRDAHGLAYFDGTHLYEHADPRRGAHPDWDTLIYDFGRPQVRSFLLSSALYWLETCHLDGLRVDAVASMLYLDYSREAGEWIPNVHGGRENLEAVDFLRELNDVVHRECPGCVVVAEESTAWPRVSHGTDRGGLGFDMKWNMGWMHDTLDVLRQDPVHRKWSYDDLTFSIWYAFSERFLLPLSHDEVVHEKGSLLAKMPGSPDDRRANLRLLYGYQWAHPGKKLLFMGGELGQRAEWDEGGQLEWALLDDPDHEALHRYVRELNRLYRNERALHERDFHPDGFEWIDCHDAERTILSFLRWSEGWEEVVVVVASFTPVPRAGYRLGVPFPGRYRLLLSSQAERWGGRGPELPPTLDATGPPHDDRPTSLEFELPGLSVVYFRWEGAPAATP